MTKVLITGGQGFCGKHLSTYLLAQGVNVYTVGRQPSTSTHFQITDITNPKELVTILESVQPNYLFHLAGVSASENPVTYYQVNVTYAAALLYALDLSGLSRHCPTLLVGTSAEYGMITPTQVPIHEETPVSPYHHYGVSKLAQTHLGLAAARTGKPLVMVRPFNIIGCGMPAHLSVQSFARQVANIMTGQQPPTIEVGNLGSSRDFIDVDDTVQIYWKLIQTPKAYGQVVNVCCGEGVVMADLLQALIRLSGASVEVKTDASRLKPLDIPVHYGCTKKLECLTQFSPKLNLDVTLQRILNYSLVNA